jgi:small-conductance mechanosensitive channel
MKFLYLVYYDNPVWAWLIALLITIVLPFAFRLVRSIAEHRLAAVAVRTKTDIDDAIVVVLQKTKFIFLLILSLYIGLQAVVLPVKAAHWLRTVTLIAFFLQIGFWSSAVVSFWITKRALKEKAEDPARVSAFGVMTFFAQLILWLILLLLVLDNLGVQITALIAGLGVGGIAIALATQNILGDVFSSMSILLDKPFEVGDFITVGDFSGTVERIGVKTTRIRSLSGELIIFANADLINSRVRNYESLQERRVVFTFGVVYQTPAEKLEAIPVMVREIIEPINQTRFDRAHFQKFGESSFLFEVVYFVTSSDYTLYMDIQHAINLNLCRRFEKEGIAFAYPTRTVYVQQKI